MTYTEEQLINLSLLGYWLSEYHAEDAVPGRHRDEEYVRECKEKAEHYENELREFLTLMLNKEALWLKDWDGRHETT